MGLGDVPRVDGEPVGALARTAEHSPSHYVIHLTGYLDPAATRMLERELVPLSWRPRTVVTLDVADAEGLDSSALWLIRQSAVRLWARKGDLEVLNPAPAVLRTLRITGLDCLVTVRNDKEREKAA